MGVTFLFEVDQLRVLEVKACFDFLKGGYAFLTPFLKFWKCFLIQNKKLWRVTFLFEADWSSGLGVKGFFLVFKEGGASPPFWNFEDIFVDSE